jgi:hypothetical protein
VVVRAVVVCVRVVVTVVVGWRWSGVVGSGGRWRVVCGVVVLVVERMGTRSGSGVVLVGGGE